MLKACHILCNTCTLYWHLSRTFVLTIIKAMSEYCTVIENSTVVNELINWGKMLLFK